MRVRGDAPSTTRSKEKMSETDEKEARKVEQLYSADPKRIVLGEREYRIPANYLGPKGRGEPDTFVAGDNGFGFFLFLPDYGGYTKENWRGGWFHPLLIQVISVKVVDKNVMIPLTDGTRQRIRPENYGEPRARFSNRRRSLEDSPSFRLFGLEGYRSKGKGTPGVTWVGTRSNGEFFFFESTLAPGEERRRGTYPSCQASYYSEQEDLRIAYRYRQEHLAKWREIDDAIWTKLRAWRVK